MFSQGVAGAGGDTGGVGGDGGGGLGGALGGSCTVWIFTYSNCWIVSPVSGTNAL